MKPTTSNTSGDLKLPGMTRLEEEPIVEVAVAAAPEYPSLSTIGDVIEKALSRGTPGLKPGSLSVNVLNENMVELVEDRGRGDLISHGGFVL